MSSSPRANALEHGGVDVLQVQVLDAAAAEPRDLDRVAAADERVAGVEADADVGAAPGTPRSRPGVSTWVAAWWWKTTSTPRARQRSTASLTRSIARAKSSGGGRFAAAPPRGPPRAAARGLRVREHDGPARAGGGQDLGDRVEPDGHVCAVRRPRRRSAAARSRRRAASPNSSSSSGDEVAGRAELDAGVAEVAHRLEQPAGRDQVVALDRPLPDPPRDRRAREPHRNRPLRRARLDVAPRAPRARTRRLGDLGHRHVPPALVVGHALVRVDRDRITVVRVSAFAASSASRSSGIVVVRMTCAPSDSAFAARSSGELALRAEPVRAERARERADRLVAAAVDEHDRQLQPLLDRGDELARQHQVGAVADEHVDLPLGRRELDAEAARDLVAHARVAVLDVVALRVARAPELVQVAGHRAGGADDDVGRRGRVVDGADHRALRGRVVLDRVEARHLGVPLAVRRAGSSRSRPRARRAARRAAPASPARRRRAGSPRA